MEIKINNLTKHYKDVVAVDNISLNISGNQIFALLGVNGAGKTTTLNMMTGLVEKTSGEIYFDQLSIDKDMDTIKSMVNTSPQETAVAFNLTVKENLLFIARIYGMSKEEAYQKVDTIMDKLHLTEVSNKRAKLLSGGMQRRLSIAMAIVSDPKILYLDEPTLGLDVIARSELWELIKELKDNMLIILTTHYMEEAESLADTVAIMDKGKIVTIDTPAKIISTTKSKSLEQAFVKIVKGGVV